LKGWNTSVANNNTVDGSGYTQLELYLNEVDGEITPPSETCFDGIQNQDETGIDCGGVCTACAEPDPSDVDVRKKAKNNNNY